MSAGLVIYSRFSKLLIINDGSDYSNWGIQACIDGLKSHFKIIFNKVDTIKHILIHQILEWDVRVFVKKILFGV